MATLRILSAVYDFNAKTSVGGGPQGALFSRKGTLSPGSCEGYQHSMIKREEKRDMREEKEGKGGRTVFFITCLLLILLFGCAGPPKPKLERGYAWGRIQLEIKPGKKFRINFEPGTPWAQFGPLEGETSEFGSMLALYPKTLDGRSEERITQDAFKQASEQGIQVDLMAVRNLMRNVRLDIERNGDVLKVTDPKPNDPDKHPLAGAVFSGAL